MLFLVTSHANLFAQDIDFEHLSKTPRDTTIVFPLDYKISRPRPEYDNWDKDFEFYYRFLTPAIRKTQASMSYTENGIVTTVTPNSIIPHAQLDIATMVDEPKKFIGTWRMIKYRSIRYNDSAYVPSRTFYRLTDTLLSDKSSDEAFAIISDNNFKLYTKEVGEDNFRKTMSAKYKIENKRYILVYKLAKTAGGVSQIGIDEKGYLIMNYPMVVENVKKEEYYSYYAVIEQLIFEKIK